MQVKSQESAFREDLQTYERKGRLGSLGRGLRRACGNLSHLIQCFKHIGTLNPNFLNTDFAELDAFSMYLR